MNDSDQNFEFKFGENYNYHQFRKAFLKFDITVRREDDSNFDDNSATRLVNNALPFCFEETCLSTTSGGDLEYKKFVGQSSTTMRAIASKDGDLLSQFDNINEGNTAGDINSTSLEEMLINNHKPAKKFKIKVQLPLEHFFGFCKTFRKLGKNLGFHSTLKTANSQDIRFTTLIDNFKVTINRLYLFVPIIIPTSETQLMFNDSIQNSFQLSYVDWYTE